MPRLCKYIGLAEEMGEELWCMIMSLSQKQDMLLYSLVEKYEDLREELVGQRTKSANIVPAPCSEDFTFTAQLLYYRTLDKKTFWERNWYSHLTQTTRDKYYAQALQDAEKYKISLSDETM